jgi:iron complex outermembrane receptor protein
MNPNSVPHPLRKSVRNLSHAVALLCIAAPSFAQSSVALKPVEVSGTKQSLQATDTAPSQGSLEARSAQSIVSDDFIRNYTSPTADYTQALTMTPGVFAYTPNGVGLGDSKITMRGLPDSNMVLSFDGIPFNDTNGVSHHSWVWFPSQALGGAVVDRSPGSAATLGQATFGGSVDLRSRLLEPDARTSLTASMGSWNTNILGIEQQTGQFGAEGKSSLMFNAEYLKSNGYQTFNSQDRKAYSGKYQYAVDATTTFTAFASYLNLKNNTPNIKGLTRANYDISNYTYLMSDDPTKADYYGYNFYDIKTDFSYAGIDMMLPGGWHLEDKLYRYTYTNKQNYNGTTITATSATDKLNSYKTYGNLLKLSKESDMGILRTGLWLDNADSYRYQIPSNPRTWVDAAVPNFSETYTTVTTQPYVEYEFKISDALRITPGVKYATYSQKFNHLADNGGAVGSLGGAKSIDNSVEYNDTLPSLDVHYKLAPNWSVYGQYAVGDQIPTTSVFDVPNAKVAVPPKPTKASTTQLGTVYTSDAYTASADVYYTELEGSYTQVPGTTANPVFAMSGTQYNQGIEGEINFALGGGFSIYVNGTISSLKYAADGKWVQGAPQDTETIGLNYERNGWALGANANRVGKMYYDGVDSAKNTLHEAYTIDPVVLSNLFVNYTIKSPGSYAKQTKVQFAVNNLMDSHSITGIATPTANATSSAPKATDVLNILPGRSINLTLTVDF